MHESQLRPTSTVQHTKGTVLVVHTSWQSHIHVLVSCFDTVGDLKACTQKKLHNCGPSDCCKGRGGVPNSNSWRAQPYNTSKDLRSKRLRQHISCSISPLPSSRVPPIVPGIKLGQSKPPNPHVIWLSLVQSPWENPVIKWYSGLRKLVETDCKSSLW